jgi:Uncharacterized protein conserved in bacteria (DUF2059)
MYCIRVHILFILLATVVAASPGMPEAAESHSHYAASLVDLVKPHEREAQAIHFMLKVAPRGFPEGIAECVVAKATPVYKEYFAALYAKHLSEAELRQAVIFFQSEAGRTAVAIQLQHEQNLFNTAAKGQQIVNEKPEYPLWVQKAVELFDSTPTGKNFGADGHAVLQPFSSEITDLRNSAMAICLADPALRGNKK